MKISVDQKTVTLDNGEVRPYTLERKRRWNIGMRKHVNELTGNIVLWTPNKGAYSIYESWDAIRDFYEQSDWRGK